MWTRLSLTMPLLTLALLALGGLAYAQGGSEAAPAAESPKFTAAEFDKATRDPSGMHILTVTEGSGDALAEGQVAVVHYTGWLVDGTQFDSSRGGDGAPFRTTIPGKVIQGWNNGLKGMKVGEVRKLYIPATLAYGNKARGDIIPADADLIFEVELLSVETFIPWTEEEEEGSETTDSGLQIFEMREGDGAELTAGKTAEVHYIGWLEDGTLFDSSLLRGETFETTIPGQLIAGWNEGMLGMKVGGWRKLRIPSKLGYGDQGSPPKIPGGATLVFEIKLVSVK